MNDAACAGREGVEVCNTRQDAETVGQCVQCTGATEGVQCPGTACEQSMGVCTDVPRRTLLACAPCVADTQCVADLRCVEHVLGTRTLGSFCFFFEQTAISCTDAGRRMYRRPMMLSSLDGSEGEYCMPITSCKAIDDATSMGSSGGKMCDNNNDCGVVSLSDGFCADSGGAVDQCSYLCEQDHDCPSSGATRCLGTPPNAFCQP
jgi:hypothetical protein